MRLMAPGTVVDGFVVGECLHAGGMAHIYQVGYADPSRSAPFPMVMKVPRMTAGDGAENIVGFEVELQLLSALTGPHVPRLVAAGDLEKLPYLVMEYVPGRTLQQLLDDSPGPLPAQEIARLGVAMAQAVHSLHLQEACHLDLKPANVLLRPDGSAVLLDFGLSCHAHYPDLLAEELRPAVGSPAWMAPEQVVGVRGDPRSDIFAVGVMLYELAVRELPFGNPQTRGGLRQRLWMDPVPPRALRPELPEWLQEVILHCLQGEADRRYASAAHLALDLSDPSQIAVTELGRRLQATGFWAHFKRWLRAAGKHYRPSALPSRQLDAAPIVMVAVPYLDVSDATLYSLRRAVMRVLGTAPGARLACVTVIDAAKAAGRDTEASETSLHRRYLGMLRQWAQPLNLDSRALSFHVIESGDVAQALLHYARGNQVGIIVMGAATHGLQMQRLLATVPIKVAMAAPCTVILVKQALPFDRLAGGSEEG
ncbi:protein kinase domain-containing protein [Polaromonas sp. CT11-55]|uniref:protein kinase domain-containing protein n=1 Tax=Polaromonas sp. CT11-55 TaxID=3243045 RepID=UPI0039A63830